MFGKKFLNLYTFYIGFLFTNALAMSLTYLYFIYRGLSYTQILVADLIEYSSAVLLLLILRKLSTKTGLVIAVTFSIAKFLLLYSLTSEYQLYLSRILVGMNMVFFSVCYNINHYRLTQKDKIGLSSGLLFSIGPILGILIPGIKGFIVDKYGFEFIFIITAVLALILFYMITKVENVRINFSLFDLFKSIKGLRMILFFEGLIESIIFSIIPLITLIYIKTPIKLGLFSSILAFAAFFGNLLFGKISDRMRNRKSFLYILPTFIALSVLSLGFSKDIYSWIMFSALAGFFLSLSWPFMIALVVDKYPKVEDSMIPREFMLNFGRIIGMTIFISIFIVFNNLYLGLIIMGLLSFIYPIFIRVKKVYN